ncbi:uncharacterized protein P174DRAFT_227745 [Aspergillus novofumigatus IBT 16806]|uniref:Uncharacterized protein n=1 Tax=Aspergillus novofumigatus (strain IBT 16806) TaxID=1392255 RepID=A0A2I1C6S3_ASPN1|nr:uncharacterized protein P174DRAFT_227745 [Aspergillus novofumigatus IBT 16806]PKX93286.1 hypothetical protein P174DRAFT_227745 [Aspergillus novofumigatus IBT 16806]
MGLYIYFQWLSMILTFLLDLISAFDNPVPREENTFAFHLFPFLLFFLWGGHGMASVYLSVSFILCVTLAHLFNFTPGDTLRSCDLFVSVPVPWWISVVHGSVARRITIV